MERTKNQLRPLAESDELQQQAQDAREHTRKDGRLTIPAELRREVFRLHRNLGHPDLQTFLRALRHAQAKPEVVEWTKKEFRCPICEASRKPSIPRPGHLVRSLEFNQTVGTDVVYFEWKGVKYPLMNNMCWGTGLKNHDTNGASQCREHLPSFPGELGDPVWSSKHPHHGPGP